MVKRIKVNLEVIEAMLYFWQATNDREKVSEKYINDVTSMDGLKLAYDDEFGPESVRRALSAVTNREPFASKNRKEGRFWNNNLWMMEDLSYTDSMIKPLKKLNLQALTESLSEAEEKSNYEEIDVIFSPLHLDEYLVVDNKLIINFFRVKPSVTDESTYIGEVELTEFIRDKIKEIIGS